MKINRRLSQEKIAKTFFVIWVTTMILFGIFVVVGRALEDKTMIGFITIDVIAGIASFTMMSILMAFSVLDREKPLKEKKGEEKQRKKTKTVIQKTTSQPLLVIRQKDLFILLPIILIVLVIYLFNKVKTLENLQEQKTTTQNVERVVLTPIPTAKIIISPKVPTLAPVIKKETVESPPLPTSKPPMPIQISSSLPTERKKVPVTLTDPLVAGTYYCYEDKANEIMTTQSNLNLALQTMNICSDGLKFKIDSCSSNCRQELEDCYFFDCSSSPDQLACHENCGSQSDVCRNSCMPSGTECGDQYGDEIDKLRNQLVQQQINYCP